MESPHQAIIVPQAVIHQHPLVETGSKFVAPLSPNHTEEIPTQSNTSRNAENETSTPTQVKTATMNDTLFIKNLLNETQTSNQTQVFNHTVNSTQENTTTFTDFLNSTTPRIVVGLPTVYREGAFYLEQTLSSLVNTVFYIISIAYIYR